MFTQKSGDQPEPGGTPPCDGIVPVEEDGINYGGDDRGRKVDVSQGEEAGEETTVGRLWVGHQKKQADRHGEVRKWSLGKRCQTWESTRTSSCDDRFVNSLGVPGQCPTCGPRMGEALG